MKIPIIPITAAPCFTLLFPCQTLEGSSSKDRSENDSSEDKKDTKKKRRAYDVESGILGAISSLSPVFQKIHDEISECLDRVTLQLAKWQRLDTELTSTMPLRDMLERRLEACQLVLADCPSVPKQGVDCREKQAQAVQKMMDAKQKWQQENTPEPYPGFFANGPLLSVCTSLKALGKDVTTKKQMDDQVKEVRALLTNHGTLVKRTNAVISKAEKAERDFNAQKKKKEEAATEAALKREASLKKAAETKTKRLTLAAEKQGTVNDLFHIDFGKLNAGKIKSYAASAAPTELDWAEPFFVRCGADGGPMAEITSNKEVSQHLNSYRNGFPNSPASTQGKMKMAHTVAAEDADRLRAAFLRAWNIEEYKASDVDAVPHPGKKKQEEDEANSISSKAEWRWPQEMQHVQVFGEGEQYVNHGTMPAEVACIKYLVTGQSMMVAMPASRLRSFFSGKNETAGGTKLADVKRFLQNLQPAEVIALMNRCSTPDRPTIRYGVVSETNLCYVPPGWVVCEKVLNQRVSIGVRVSFLAKSLDEHSHSFSADLRSMQELVINGSSHSSKSATQLGIWVNLLWQKRNKDPTQPQDTGMTKAKHSLSCTNTHGGIQES